MKKGVFKAASQTWPFPPPQWGRERSGLGRSHEHTFVHSVRPLVNLCALAETKLPTEKKFTAAREGSAEVADSRTVSTGCGVLQVQVYVLHPPPASREPHIFCAAIPLSNVKMKLRTLTTQLWIQLWSDRWLSLSISEQGQKSVKSSRSDRISAYQFTALDWLVILTSINGIKFNDIAIKF